jgi:hypothetical protein
VREWPGLSFLPTSDTAKQAVIAFTVATELAVPWLWLFARTRLVGLACLWTLSLGMVLNTRAVYFEFIGLFWACSLWWLEPGVLAATSERLTTLVGRAPRWLHDHRRWPRAATWLKTGSAGALSGLAWQGRGQLGESPWKLAWLLPPVIVVCVVSVVALRTALARRHVQARTLRTARDGLGFGWLVVLIPLLLWANELSIYVGLPHRPALTMAANFSTAAGHSNHWLIRSMPTLPALASVVIESSTLPKLQRGDHLTLMHLRHLVAKHPEVQLRARLLDGGDVIEITSLAQAAAFGERSRLVTWLGLRTYRATPGRIPCDKAEPGETTASTHQRMVERLASEGLARGLDD